MKKYRVTFQQNRHDRWVCRWMFVNANSEADAKTALKACAFGTIYITKITEIS